MDTFTQSILGNLVADILLFGGMALFSFLYLRAKRRLGNIGKDFILSPNRKRFSSEVDGDIYVSDEQGTRNLTNSRSTESGAMWAGNSRWIAYARKLSDKFQVIVTDVETKKSVCLSEGPGEVRPVEWHPNGDLIVKLGGSYLTIYKAEIEKRLR